MKATNMRRTTTTATTKLLPGSIASTKSETIKEIKKPKPTTTTMAADLSTATTLTLNLKHQRQKSLITSSSSPPSSWSPTSSRGRTTEAATTWSPLSSLPLMPKTLPTITTSTAATKPSSSPSSTPPAQLLQQQRRRVNCLPLMPMSSPSTRCRRRSRIRGVSCGSCWPRPFISNAAIFYLLAAFTLCALPSVTQALINCPIGCSCDDVALVVKCSEGTLDVVPITLNPSIQRLIITNNKKIRTFDSSIQFYYDLTYLDLSHNELVNIPADTFKMQSKLRELNLSHNKIGQINNKTFNGLAAVTVLNLRGNLLAELERATFTSVIKVAELNLGANRISSIDPRAFDSLINLRVLCLDDNTLTTLPTAETFHAMPSLAELFLGTNSFETLPSGVFDNVKGLTRLDLRSAGLVYNISEDAFSGLEGLRALDLSDNRLQQVPTAALSRLQRLEELSLGQNDFDVILPGAFNGLKNLKRLEITGTQHLERIANGAFAENTNLEYLNFSGNKMLSTIEENALRGLPNLRTIILRENQLGTLAEGLFPWSDLETLDLTDNPIVCDCHVLWLRNLLISSNESNWNDLTSSSATSNSPRRKIENVLCTLPERFHGEPLAQLSPTVLGCSSGATNSQALIGVVIVSVTVVLSLLFFLLYGCRRRIRETLKGGWGNSALGRKEREYQKTFSDEDYMTRQRHPCLGLGGVHPTLATAPYANDTLPPGNYNSHNPAYMGSRPIPVTEL